MSNDQGRYQTGRFHTGERWCVALYRRGRTRLHLVLIDDGGVKHQAVPLGEERYVRPLLLRGNEYPVARMVRRLVAAGSRSGITEAARVELVRARGGAHG